VIKRKLIIFKFIYRIFQKVISFQISFVFLIKNNKTNKSFIFTFFYKKNWIYDIDIFDNDWIFEFWGVIYSPIRHWFFLFRTEFSLSCATLMLNQTLRLALGLSSLCSSSSTSTFWIQWLTFSENSNYLLGSSLTLWFLKSAFFNWFIIVSKSVSYVSSSAFSVLKSSSPLKKPRRRQW